MWAILDVILELLAELLLQIIGEALLELGWESLRTRRARMHPVPATLGLAAFGAAAGALSAWLVPHRLTSLTLAPAWSLLVTPLVIGAALHAFGAWRRGHGHATTHLATFHGGGAFALGYALTRYLMLA